MEVQFKRNVRIICDLSIGDKVKTNGFSRILDKKECVVEDVKTSIGCESGFLVKIDGYENYLDSDWLIKI